MTFTVAAVVVCFGIGTILNEVLVCRPFAKNWNLLLPGICGSASAAILAEAVIKMLLDIAIISLPMPMIWGLQMTQRRGEITLTVLFGLGSMYVLALVVSL